MFFAFSAFAQERTITGTVTSADDNLPIPGVSVKIQGTTIGVSTNANGGYSIKLPSDKKTIVFSSLGFATKEITVGTSTSINVSLATDSKQLGEVLVTAALGIKRTAKSLGYAVTALDGDELNKARETNVINALAGKVAGVKITSQSGTVGGSSKIIIRGASSFNSGSTSNQPIFVIDGLPIDNGSQQLNTITTSSVPQGSAGSDYGNRAGDLNSDDIESMTVLKGAAATALYGARAKNGAIVITTKKGKKGQASVSVNSSTRFDDVLKLPDFQNEYAQGVQGQYSTGPNIQSGSTNGWGPKISDVQDKTFLNFLNQQVTLQAFPDNVKDFYNTGKTYINSVAFEGGGETGDYRFGFTNTTQTGIIPNEKLRKNVINFNAGRNILKGLDIRTNLNYVRTAADGRPVQSSNNPNVLQPLIYGLPRTLDINLLKDNYIDPITKQQITLTPARNGNNPYWIANKNNFANVVDRVYGNGIITYKPLDWLTISDNLGTDFYNEYRRGTTSQGTIGSLTGDFYTANIYNRIINNDFLITADHKITSDLSLKVIAGYNVYDAYYRRDLSDAQQLTVDELYVFSNAGSVTTTNTSNRKRIQGVYGDIGLSYKDFLFLNITGRNDWTSTLPITNRSYFYPSVSSSFVFSELLPKTNWFNFGKLRASYANVGSDTGPYQGAFVYSPISAAFAQYGYGTTFPFNGVLAFSSPSTIPNLDLKPQNQVSYEVGTELRFLNNRVTLDFTYYNTNTQDQIVSLPLPQSTGFSAALKNAGSVRNNGVEIALGLVPLKSRDFKWNIDFNFAKNNQTIDLPSEITSYSLASGWSGLSIKAESGKSFGIYGVAWLRDGAGNTGNIVIDPATGLRKTISDQRLGNMNPDWMGGINNTFTYKGASLSFLIDIRKGGVIYSNTVSSLRTSGLAKETLLNRGNIFIDNGVVASGSTFVPNTTPVTSMQDYWSQYTTTNTEANIFDASYVKLREVRLSYQLPSKFLQRIKFIKSAELGIEGRNLWIIHDNVPHIDPEANFFGTESVAEGVEFNSVPSTRTLGFNIRFKI